MLLKRDALHKGMLKSDIDAFLAGKGEYVQIDHLTRFMKDQLPVDIRRYVATLLAQIYEKKGMALDAGKMYEVAAMCSVTFADKIKYYTKDALVYVKTGMFERVDDAMMKAFAEATSREKTIIQAEIIEAYKKVAQEHENTLKRANAVKIYEKLLSMAAVSEADKIAVRNKLGPLYEKLGRIDKYMTNKKVQAGKNIYGAD